MAGRAHPIERIAAHEAALDAISRQRELTPDEITEAKRIRARRVVIELRLRQQIAATRQKLERLERISAHVR